MALSAVVKHLYDGSWTLSDGAGTPVTLSVDYAHAAVTLSGVHEKLRDVVAYEVRGAFKTVRHTTRVYPTITLEVTMTDLSEDVSGTVADFVLGNGTIGAAIVSTSGANADVRTLDLIFAGEFTDLGDAADGAFTCKNVYFVLDVAEGEPNTFTLTGTVYGAIIGDLAQAQA
jgi:hypothetical protein